MKKSKISRSLVVVIFIAMIIFLSYLDIKLFLNYPSNNAKISLVSRVCYALLLIFSVLMYMFIKTKLYRMKVKRFNSLIYRSIYLFVLVLFARIFTLKYNLEVLVNPICIITLALNIGAAFILKRIIFNISKSDVLSVIAIVLYSTLINVGLDNKMLLITAILQITLFLSIWLIQVLIDELKQKGIKTKKYIVISLLIGVLISITTMFGINKFVWCAVFLILLFITVDLDNTHITFPRKFMYSVSNIKRDKLYKIETFNIGKIFISGIFVITVLILLNYGFVYLFNNVLVIDDSSNFIVSYIKDSLNSSFNINLVRDNLNKLLDLSKTYDLVLFAYILLLEFLSFILRRRYDTKTTMLKSLFIAIIITACASVLDIIYFQPVMLTLLILIAIVNTSSIYLNREERIKLLVA